MSRSKNSQNVILHLIVAFFLLYHIGVLDFLRSSLLLSLCSYAIILVSLISCGLFLKEWKVSILDVAVMAYAFLLPVLCSVRSLIVFGQPIQFGLLSMRYGLIILFGYFLYIFRYDFPTLLEQINRINLCVASVSIIALFVFGLDPTQIGQFMATTNTLEENEIHEDLVKGIKLTVCARMMMISYIYYLLRIFKKPSDIKGWAAMGILMVYLLFVHKGRQPFVALAVIYMVYCIRMKPFTKRKLLMMLLPFLAVPLIFLSGSSLTESLLSIFGIGDISDSSTLARLEDIVNLWPYIKDYPLMGFGKLSVHFMDGGFHSIFGTKFYIDDLGIIGALAQGGLVQLALYAWLYTMLWKRSREISLPFYGEFDRYMLIDFVIMLFLGNDFLFAEKTMTIAFLFYPLYGYGSPDRFFGANGMIKCKF